MLLSRSVKASVIVIAGLLVLGGCKDTGETYKKSQRRSQTQTQTKEQPEYDCRIHAPDKICEVPWKDKVVLYCYKGKIPKVVRYREEC